MNVVLWALAAVLAVVFAGAGTMKLTQPKEKLVAAGMGWADGYSVAQLRAIGAIEVLGAVGVVLPAFVSPFGILVPLAASGLAIVMVIGAVIHARLGEYPLIAVNVLLFAIAVVVAWGRFGSYAFD